MQAGLPQDGCIVVGNHLGVADILWMLYAYGPAFVAKEEVRGLPVVGPISDLLLKCIFVDRLAEQKGEGTGAAILRYFTAGQLGRRLCLFPEGTTSNGRQVINFRTGAFIADVPVIPHAIRCSFRQGWQFDPHYTAIQLPRYLLGLMSQPWNSMRVDRLEAIPPGPSPRERAEAARLAIAKALNVPLADASYKDKMAYEVSIGHKKLPPSSSQS